MGFRPRTNTWNKGAETAAIKAQENTLNTSDLISAYEVQAKNFSEDNPNLVQAFKSQKFHTQIVGAQDPVAKAKQIARNEPHFIPETVDEIDEQAAFLVAFATELAKPEYNQ